MLRRDVCGCRFARKIRPQIDWATQQAGNFQIHLQDKGLPCKILQLGQDSKYVDLFREVFRSVGCKLRRKAPIRSQAFKGSWSE